MKIRNGKTIGKWGLISALLLIIIGIKVFSSYPATVEKVYSTGLYAAISAFLRGITGWLPLSLGDILYLAAGIWIVWKVWRLAARIYRRKFKKGWFPRTVYRVSQIIMLIYIVFNVFWGINYNREQLSDRLGLQLSKKDTIQLKEIGRLLLQKVNTSKRALIDQHARYPDNGELFKRAVACYRQAQNTFPFLSYRQGAVKQSLFGLLGNYFGFTGYYNPFSGEAQVNTRIPKFVLPYTTVHEIAHQLGYAKEEEANFAGYLAATNSTDTLFHYSTYLDLFVYANRQLFFIDSVSAKGLVNELIPEVKADIREWREFLRKHKNPLEPVIRWAYGNYLKANQQPKGMTSYDEVIADVIAFYKKYGKI